MTFEEFFKKKKIDLTALQNGEPVLFAEFKDHYERMGEKSFDHTKKYWFNQLRHRFPAPVEAKVEKVHIENQLAEQTITEALTETAAPASVGFKPRFKAGIVNKPAEDKPGEAPPAPTEEKPAETPTPAVGFKPRFKASMVSKSAEEKPTEEIPTEAKSVEELPEAPQAKPAVGFKPRFKAGVTNRPVEERPADVTPPAPEEKTEDTTVEKPAETAPKPVGFKPRFKAGVTNKPAEEQPAEAAPPAAQEKTDEPPAEQPASTAPKPMGFKPRFKAKE